MKSENQSIYVRKFNKLKEIVSSKKKKAFEATAGKFVSNGSLLSQNGLKGSEANFQNKLGGELSMNMFSTVERSVAWPFDQHSRTSKGRFEVANFKTGNQPAEK